MTNIINLWIGQMARLPRMREVPAAGGRTTVFETFALDQEGCGTGLDSASARCLVSRRTNGSADARAAAKILSLGPARPGDAGAGSDCRLSGGRPDRGGSAFCRRHL